MAANISGLQGDLSETTRRLAAAEQRERAVRDLASTLEQDKVTMSADIASLEGDLSKAAEWWMVAEQREKA
eukprot:510123-Pyramimonas_sp.AAC.1